MARGYALALQAALIAALKADGGISALVGVRIYDEPPQNALRPYISIGGIELRPLRSDCGRAATVTFGIEAHSRPDTSGRGEATECAEAIVSALDQAPLEVVGFTVIQMHWLTQSVERDVDGKSYTAIATFSTILDG
ncbi:DUF3168 domain-containing protein [Sulfitobacter sp.]|uniref:DUF3168 domain-containing protein n=1 Tax=Sulfitobacter sp. TaxID=1903071 RepID=UPI0030023B12